MKDSFLKRLIKLLESSDLDSLHISSFWGMNKIKLFKSSHQTISKSNLKEKMITPTESPLITSENSVKADTSIGSSSKENNLESEELSSRGENISVPQDEFHEVIAPLVGTFYVSPKAGDPPFIKEGDKIEKGQTICIIEAMKIFNEIESEVSGVVKKILVQDISPVEYGEPIVLIDINVQ